MVQLLVHLLGTIQLALDPRQLGHVVGRFIRKLADLVAQRVVVLELVLALFNGLVDVVKVAHKAHNGLQHGLPEGTINGADGLGVKLLHGREIEADRRGLGARGSTGVVEGVNGLGNARLCGGHGPQRVQVALGLDLQLPGRLFQRHEPAVLKLKVLVNCAFNMTGFHHNLEKEPPRGGDGVSLEVEWGGDY